MRRLPASLVAYVLAAGIAAAVALGPGAGDGAAAQAQALALPAADAVLPKQPAALAATLASTTLRLRGALTRWDAIGAVPRDVTYLALHHQRMLRLMAKRRALGDSALARLPQAAPANTPS